MNQINADAQAGNHRQTVLPEGRPWEEVLQFWFPDSLDEDIENHGQRWAWRMRGGADAAIMSRFPDLTEQAANGALDDWAEDPRGRLALIILLDQFPRSVWRDTPRAFA